MEQVGTGEGIKFKFGGKIGNTRDSHRLIAEAGIRGGDLQDRLVTALFHSYFEVNEDTSSKETLARIAKDVGLFENEKKGMKFLNSEERGAEVDKEVDFNQYRRGISGVPHFIIDGNDLFESSFDVVGQAEVGGAQDPRVFQQIFAQVEKFKETKAFAEGDVCLPDGSNC